MPERVALPSLREARAAVMWTLGLTLATLFMQTLALEVVQARFSEGSIGYPLAAGPVMQAGDWTNLIGWGYFVNRSSQLPELGSMVVWVVVSLLAYRLFAGASILGLAGGLANLVELEARGFVLDWIIVPSGGDAIRGYSLGDLLIYGGWAWMLGVFVALLVCLFRALVPTVGRSRRGDQKIEEPPSGG